MTATIIWNVAKEWRSGLSTWEVPTTELAHLGGTDLAVGQVDIGDNQIVIASLL